MLKKFRLIFIKNLFTFEKYNRKYSIMLNSLVLQIFIVLLHNYQI